MWKEWFTYSRGERLGISLLAVMVAILILWPTVRDAFVAYPHPATDQKLMDEIDSFLTTLRYIPPQDYSLFSFESEERAINLREREVFPFDPNTITLPDLKLSLIHISEPTRPY